MKLFLKYFLFFFMFAASATIANVGFSYFQAKFHCLFSNNNLQIINSSQPGSRNCLDLIAQLRGKRNDLARQIGQISGDSSYVASAKIKLEEQRADISVLMNKVYSGMNNLEIKMLLSYKKKYFTQLKSIRTRLLSKQAILTADFASAIIDGQKEEVETTIKTIGLNYQRIIMIQGILSSRNLNEMIPMLDAYQSLITSQISGKSE